MNSSNTSLRDIQDGRVYQKFLKQNEQAGKNVFSLIVSSDGAPMIKSRKYSVWPLICVLVELPPHERYKFKNVLLTGLWYGRQKPEVKIFLKPFVEEISTLSHDFEFYVNDVLMAGTCRIQSVVPDLPAKAMLFHITQFNGQFGCSTCHHPGIYDKELRSRIYEYKSEKISRRNAKESTYYANLAEQHGGPVMGFKGKNVFGKLVSIPDNLPIDWMHCVCEGVLKRQLFNRWFGNSFIGEDYSLIHFQDELDTLFTSTKIPHDFTRKPRSFSERKHWKASEFRLFVLFAGLPLLRYAVLSDAFDLEYFYHFALLVTSLRYLHAVPVIKSNVNKAQVLLDNFVRLLPILYSKKESTYNSHALLHLPQQVLDNGALSLTSAFVFESFIAHLKNLFNGTRGIAKQMVEKLGISQMYGQNMLQHCRDVPEVTNFAQKLLRETKSSGLKVEGGIIFHNPMKYCKLEKYEQILQMELNTEQSEYQISYRMTKDKITYHSIMYPRKGKSSSYIVEYCLSYENSEYGEVICYILHDNKAYALIQKYNKTGADVCQGLEVPQDAILQEIVGTNLIGMHFVEVDKTDQPILVNCTSIGKRCIYISNDIQDKGFVTSLDTPYEHD